MKFHIGVLILLFISACQIENNEEKETYNDLILGMKKLTEEIDFNGVILLTKDSSVIFSKAIGYADLENKLTLDLNHQFVIGSISKQITAVLVLKAYEKEQLKLSDKIQKYLKDINQPWAKEVSIHHLLTHTHGIKAINEPLEFEQGSEFKYSQLGYELLAQILKKVTNKSFQALSMELFQANGLNDTFHPKSEGYNKLVKGYEAMENGDLEYTIHSLYNYPAAGSFISTVSDLAKWNQLLHSEKLIQRATLERMKKRYATRNHPIFETVEYGYGLLFKAGEKEIQIGALGYAPGFVSAAYYYPKAKMNLIVLENTAEDLDDFKETFKVHLKMMNLVKSQQPNKK